MDHPPDEQLSTMKEEMIAYVENESRAKALKTEPTREQRVLRQRAHLSWDHKILSTNRLQDQLNTKLHQSSSWKVNRDEVSNNIEGRENEQLNPRWNHTQLNLVEVNQTKRKESEYITTQDTRVNDINIIRTEAWNHQQRSINQSERRKRTSVGTRQRR